MGKRPHAQDLALPLTLRQIRLRIDRLAVVADFEVHHLARRTCAAHLGDLLDDFNGSYVLTLVAYNAGPGRARQWVKLYGHPSDASVDPVDWIELIPYAETRNYVQRVLENLRVYRQRLKNSQIASATVIVRRPGRCAGAAGSATGASSPRTPACT